MLEIEARRGAWLFAIALLSACGQPKPSESAQSARADVAAPHVEPLPRAEQSEAKRELGDSATSAEPGCDGGAALSPLAQAAFEGEAELARVLVVDAERDASTTSGCEATPLMMAIAPYTEEPGTERSEVRARTQGKLDAAGLFLARCFNVTGKDASGTSALHVAARAPYPEHVVTRLVQRMLECGAQPDVQTNDGVTPLMLAVQAKRKKLAHELIEAGADVNLASQAGDSALSLAESMHDKDLVKLLRKGPTRDAGG
jgi:Ankyrin repeats (3 copies)